MQQNKQIRPDFLIFNIGECLDSKWGMHIQKQSLTWKDICRRSPLKNVCFSSQFYSDMNLIPPDSCYASASFGFRKTN